MAIRELESTSANWLAQQVAWLQTQPALLHHGYKLRPATRADRDAILVLERYCFSPWLAFGRRHWHEQLRRQSRRVWLVLDGDQVLAYMALLPHGGWQQVSVTALAVHWQHRGQGLGALLLSLAELEARARGLGRIRLEVDCDNDAALRLYRRHGYVALCSIPDYYGVGRPGVRLEKRLPEMI